MRTIPFKWLFAQLIPTLAIAMIAVGLVLMLLCPASATPVEEDIPQSPPVRHVKARPTPAADEPTGTSGASGSPASPDEATSAPQRNQRPTDSADAGSGAVGYGYGNNVHCA